jgi:hypothetical protein
MIIGALVFEHRMVNLVADRVGSGFKHWRGCSSAPGRFSGADRHENVPLVRKIYR